VKTASCKMSVARSGCLYFKTAHRKIVRPSNCSEDGNRKLLRNIDHVAGDWNRHRTAVRTSHLCFELSLSRALQSVAI
jgi:hypothetical protein